MSRRGLGAPFWRLFGSSATSNLADGIGRTALPLLAASLTRDPLLISGLVTLAFLPWLLFGLLSGVLVDRVDRRLAMAVANVFRALAIGALGVAVLVGSGSIVAVYVAAFLLGVAETVYDSAVRAMLPAVVRRDQLEAGNGLLAMEETVGQTFLGTPLGAALFAILAAAPLLINAVGFAAAAVLVLTLRGNFRHARPEPTSVRSDIKTGLRWLRAHRLLRALMLATAAICAVSAMPDAVLVLYVLQDLGVPESGFGLFLVAAGIGALGGSAVAGRLGARIGRTLAMALATAVGAAAYLVIGLITSALLAGALFAIAGATVMIWNILSMSLRQALIPEELFGRVQGAWRTVVWGGIPLGSLAGGAIATVTSVRTVFVLSGVLLLVIALGTWLVLRAHRDEVAAAFGSPEPVPSAITDA